MEMYIHYKSLPEGKDLHDVLGELDEVLWTTGRASKRVCWTAFLTAVPNPTALPTAMGSGTWALASPSAGPSF